MSNLIEALKNGWTVSDVANVLARGRNDEGRGFLVTLMEPKNHLFRKVYLPYSKETEALLNQSTMPLAAK
jgi:hypothetical protein